MKKKLKMVLFVALYILSYLFLCIFPNIGAEDFSSGNTIIWIFLGFFLVLFTIWQTDLKDKKLNRVAFCGLGITMLLAMVAMIIVSLLNGDGVLVPVISILFVLVVCFGGGIGIFYLSKKKQGKLNSYETYKDIMTEEEFERWQTKKMSGKDGKR